MTFHRWTREYINSVFITAIGIKLQFEVQIFLPIFLIWPATLKLKFKTLGSQTKTFFEKLDLLRALWGIFLCFLFHILTRNVDKSKEKWHQWFIQASQQISLLPYTLSVWLQKSFFYNQSYHLIYRIHTINIKLVQQLVKCLLFNKVSLTNIG